VPFNATWRRVRRQFTISAPRMAVRTALPWPWRAGVGIALVVLVGGMWWWGFDFGQIFGGFNRKEIEGRIVTLESETAKAIQETSQLRARNSQLETELAMMQGAQQTLTRQSADLAQENTRIKEELAFLQKLVSDSSKAIGLAIQRMEAEPAGEDAWRYSLLIVRGGTPRDDFEGQLTLQATLSTPTMASAIPRQTVITLPDDQPDAAAPLKLRFKYYQRVEGMFRVPPGAQLRALTARAYEAGQGNPRATRTLNPS
jgi:hypothetical protein